MAPAIHIGPDAPEHLVRAVEAGGGLLVELEAAEGVVWAGSEDLPELPASVKWVQLQSAGIEPWIERILATPGVTFTTAAGAYSAQVAEVALGLLLAGIRGFNQYARAWSWAPHDNDGTLAGSTVAVIGAGGIGRELIKRLEPHDVKILAVTRSGRDGTIPVDRIGEIWGEADHFVLCAPATEETHHLIGAPELWVMKSHSWVINVARGSLIDTEALIQALASGIIGGAGLDVTDPEPLPNGHPLWASPHALITPHVANPPAAMARDLAKRVTENVRRFGAGEPLLAPVNLEQGY